MWRKKEFCRMYCGLQKKVKIKRRINNRNRMTEGTEKMKLDAKAEGSRTGG
jgi:hypothetical protein